MSKKKDAIAFYRLKNGFLKTIESFNRYYTNTDDEYLFEEFIGNLYNMLQSIRKLEGFLGESDELASLNNILEKDVEIPKHISYRFSYDRNYYELFRNSRNMDGHLEKIDKNKELLIARGLDQDVYIEILQLVKDIYSNRLNKISEEEMKMIASSSQYADTFLDPYRKLLIDSKELNGLEDKYPLIKQVLEFEPNENNVELKD